MLMELFVQIRHTIRLHSMNHHHLNWLIAFGGGNPLGYRRNRDINATSLRADTNAYIHGVSHAALNIHSHVLSFFPTLLSLSLSIHDIYIGVHGTSERGKFGCNNPKLLSCRLSVDPHFSKYLQSSPDPSRPFKGFPRLNEGKR